MELDQKIEDLVQPISDFFTDIIFVSISFQNNSLPLVVIWLVFASLFFTFYFRFINIRAFKRAFLVAIGRYDKPDSPGEITHFQAFTAAMSGTIGLGNIAGVAVAISIGGPGAMLWMIIMAFFVLYEVLELESRPCGLKVPRAKYTETSFANDHIYDHDGISFFFDRMQKRT